MTYCDRCHKECSDDEPAKVGEEIHCYACRERLAIQREEKTT